MNYDVSHEVSYVNHQVSYTWVISKLRRESWSELRDSSSELYVSRHWVTTWVMKLVTWLIKWVIRESSVSCDVSHEVSNVTHQVSYTWVISELRRESWSELRDSSSELYVSHQWVATWVMKWVMWLIKWDIRESSVSCDVSHEVSYVTHQVSYTWVISELRCESYNKKIVTFWSQCPMA